jgi:hypothetical protein
MNTSEKVLATKRLKCKNVDFSSQNCLEKMEHQNTDKLGYKELLGAGQF